MLIDKKWQNEVKRINRGLYIKWDESFKRWIVRHKDDRTGLDRHVCTVETNDGEYMDLNLGVLRILKDRVAWELIGKFPEPKDLWLYLVKEYKAAKAKAYLDRRAYIQWWNRDHRTEWRAAIENAQRGIFTLPEEQKRNIIIT